MARKFAQAYSVALLARKPANYEPLVKEIESDGGKAIGISCDVTNGKNVQEAFDAIKKEMGGAKLAAAIFNVGGRFVRKPFLDLSEDEFISGFEANGYVNPEAGRECFILTYHRQERGVPFRPGRLALTAGRHVS